MKATHGFLLLSVLAVLGYSCTVRQLDEAATPLPEGTELSFTATLDDEALTRSTLGNNYSFLWSPGEQVNLFYGNGGNTPGSLFVSQNSVPASSAVFLGNITAFTGGGEGNAQFSFWSISPYAQSNRCDGTSVQATLPTVQQAVEENFADNTMLLVANSPGLALSYRHVGTFLRVCVTNADIVSITFKGNSGEIVGGRVSVTMDANGKPVWSPIEGEGSTSVRLEGPDGGCFVPGKYYLLTFLPQTFQDGWSLVFEKSDGSVGKYTKTGSATFTRASSKNASNRDADLTYIPMYVQMGPNFFWGRMNLGATSPEEYGDYFAWGETSPKDDYSWATYTHMQAGKAHPYYINKYTVADNKTAAIWYDGDTFIGDNGDGVEHKDLASYDYADDAARIIWGSTWRTPTDVEWTWLRQNCTWTWTADYEGTGTAGIVVTSNVTGFEGNSIFLPAAGSRYGTGFADVVGSCGYYWSSSILKRGTDGANVMYFDSEDAFRSLCSRLNGLSVRPVYGRSATVPVTDVSFKVDNYAVLNGGTTALTATVAPEDATNQNLIWTSSDSSVANISPTGVVTGKKVGTTTVTARTVDGGFTATCTVTVIPNASFVDMGNGTIWATCNVGAGSPEESGGYYAWGETTMKLSYSWSNYAYGTSSNLTKYNSSDKKTYLESVDDAATANMGSNWRMPSQNEWLAMKNNSVWNWGEMNGKKGYIVKSSITGYENSIIFLPAAGRYYSSGFDSIRTAYWTANLSGVGSENARCFYISSSTYALTNFNRYIGCTVRAVYDPRQFIGGRECVDMGNGLKWAKTNIGADSPEEYGDYFCWGATATQASYFWLYYPFMQSGKSDENYITKYTFADNNKLGIWYDGDTFIGDNGDGVEHKDFASYNYADDAARVIWGSTWRTPTDAEWTWLLENCTWTWTADYKGTGKAGVVMTSNVTGFEGRSIFLPAAGGRFDTDLYLDGSSGHYWSSSLGESRTANARAVDFSANRMGRNYTERVVGHSIRPVSD